MLDKGKIAGYDDKPVAGKYDGIGIAELLHIYSDGLDSIATEIAQAAEDKPCSAIPLWNGVFIRGIHADVFCPAKLVH